MVESDRKVIFQNIPYLSISSLFLFLILMVYFFVKSSSITLAFPSCSSVFLIVSHSSLHLSCICFSCSDLLQVISLFQKMMEKQA